METNKVELKQIQKISEVITYLEGLLKGFKAGKIVVQQGESFVSMVPAEQVEVEVAAKKKKNKEKFSIELSWHSAVCSEPVTITTKEPISTPPAEEKKTSAAKPVPAKSETNAPAATKAAPATKVTAAKDKVFGDKGKPAIKK